MLGNLGMFVMLIHTKCAVVSEKNSSWGHAVMFFIVKEPAGWGFEESQFRWQGRIYNNSEHASDIKDLNSIQSVN